MSPGGLSVHFLYYLRQLKKTDLLTSGGETVALYREQLLAPVAPLAPGSLGTVVGKVETEFTHLNVGNLFFVC